MEYLATDNPYRIPRPALIQFSGGRTSRYMAHKIIEAYGGTLPDDIVIVFANTGKEMEATLKFVHDCEVHWGIPIVWLEFDPKAEHSTKIVSYETASRNGEPLDAAIATRPTQHLFNRVSRYCTGTTKIRRVQKYARKWMGWGDFNSAIGLRADEMSRVNSMLKAAGRDKQWPVMPLATAGVTKEIIGEWSSQQPFDLELPNIEGVTPLGNCVLCPLKSRAKLVNILRVMPEEAEWWIHHEDVMGAVASLIPKKDNEPDLRPFFMKKSKQRNKVKTYTGVSYRELLEEARLANERNDPFDYGIDPGIDCFCGD